MSFTPTAGPNGRKLKRKNPPASVCGQGPGGNLINTHP
jgi:hypothetical protein